MTSPKDTIRGLIQAEIVRLRRAQSRNTPKSSTFYDIGDRIEDLTATIAWLERAVDRDALLIVLETIHSTVDRSDDFRAGLAVAIAAIKEIKS